MYPPFTLDLPVPSRALTVGEPVFGIEKDGWFIRPGCVTTAEPLAPDVHVEHRVPPDVEELFGPSAAQAYLSLGKVGIEEPVSSSLVVPMEDFAEPLPGGDTLPAGTIVVLLRPEPFRVQLAQLEMPLSDHANADVSMRLLAPSPAGSSLAAVGASMKAAPGTFVAVARFASGLRESFVPDPVEPRYFLA